MFYEKYKDAFDSGGNQAPFQKQLFDLRGIQSNIAKKNNTFAKNATNIISSGNNYPNLNINTSLRLEPDRGNGGNLSSNRGVAGRSYPSLLPSVKNNERSQLNGLQFNDRLASASRVGLGGRDTTRPQQMVSSMLKDAFSWNDESNANKFRAMRVQRFNARDDLAKENAFKNDYLSSLQRSQVDIPNVGSSHADRQALHRPCSTE